MSVTVAATQFAAGTDPDQNRLQAIKAIETAAGLGAELVVLPENSMYSDPGKSKPDEQYAEPLTGAFVSALQEAANRLRLGIVAGMTESVPSDHRGSNTLVYITPEGRLESVYRKVHLYDAFGYKESDKVLPADLTDPLLFTMGGITFGAMTCYDLRFPEMARYLVDAGAAALLLPAAWAVGPAKEMHWDTLLRARAIENTAYVVGVGQTGPFCTGQSMIIDPMGTTIASAGEVPANALATLEPERVTSIRTVNPSVSNRKFAVVPA